MSVALLGCEGCATREALRAGCGLGRHSRRWLDLGWHCALSSDVPLEVIERARAVSRCRADGRPIAHYARDGERHARAERSRVDVVNAFIEADFGGDDGAADKYFEKMRDAFRAITVAA